MSVDLSQFRVARLSATTFPVREYEQSLIDRHGLPIERVEEPDPEGLLESIEDCDAIFIITNYLPADAIDRLAKCRVISRLGTGCDKIDVEHARKRGILVTNVPYFCIEEQADHALALMLSLERKLPQMAQLMREGAWQESREIGKTNRRVSTRTLGLVGFGNSAKALAQRAGGFGMRILATRRNMDAPRDEADRLGVEMVDLDTVLRESDYVSLHLDLSKATHHMINAESLSKMKPDAFLINTSRGAIVDEFALADALRSGRLRGAGIDTFEKIDVHCGVDGPQEHPFFELDNIILTPHTAAASVEAAQDVSRGAIENVVSILNGRWPADGNVVNRGVEPRIPLEPHDPSLSE
jgi:phosphoglycerate dehydrogenase-like enzyme